MPQEDKIADNAEDTRKFGRRSTDNPGFKGSVSQASNSNWRSVFNGLGLAFILTVCVTTGRLLGQMDSNVKEIDTAKQERKELMKQILDVVIVLKEQNVQQRESDKRFEEKFDDANDKLDRINDGVQKNRESIIILQNSGGKLSGRDKTKVDYLAMR